MLCGYPPFMDDTDAGVLNRVRQGTFTFEESGWKDISAQVLYENTSLSSYIIEYVISRVADYGPETTTVSFSGVVLLVVGLLVVNKSANICTCSALSYAI